MHPASNGQPDPEWVRWAETESVRRLKLSLQEIQARKQAEAAVEKMERALSVWDRGQSPSEPERQIVLSPPPALERVIRIHSENLLDA